MVTLSRGVRKKPYGDVLFSIDSSFNE